MIFGKILWRLGAVVFLVYICTLGIKNIIRYNVYVKLHHSWSDKQARLLDDVFLLRNEKERLTRPHYWEVLSKQRLGYVKKGETVYKVVKE